MEEDATARPELLRAFTGLQAISSIALIIWSMLFLIETIGMFETLRDKHRLERNHRRLQLFLYGNSCANVICFIVVSIMAWHRSLDAVWCNVLDRLACFLYCVQIQFTYLFLLERSKIVGSIKRNRFYNLISVGCRMTVIGIVPTFLIPTTLMTFRGVLTSEGLCIQWSTSWIVWVFVVLNLILGITLMYLFIKPIVNSAEVLQGIQKYKADRLLVIARRNLYLALIACTVTTIVFSTTAVLTEVASQKGSAYDHYRVIGLTLIVSEIHLVGVICRLMTSIWAPRRLGLWFGEFGSRELHLVTTTSSRTFQSSSFVDTMMVDSIFVIKEGDDSSKRESIVVPTEMASV